MMAGLIWKHLFVDRSPASDACRGVLTTTTYWPGQPRVEASPSFYSRMAQALRRQTWISVPTNGSSVRDDDQRSVSKLEEGRPGWATRSPRHLCHLDELNSTLATDFNAAAKSSYGLESADETLHRIIGGESAYSLNNN
ncbi:unnamed protein product [Peronospora effusa]|nr:unnamed protein product [Peronospora effusa]